MLDALYADIGCDYLSDLVDMVRAKSDRLVMALENIKADDYPVEDWNEALKYLLEIEPVETAQEAKELLLKKITKQGGDS